MIIIKLIRRVPIFKPRPSDILVLLVDLELVVLHLQLHMPRDIQPTRSTADHHNPKMLRRAEWFLQDGVGAAIAGSGSGGGHYCVKLALLNK